MARKPFIEATSIQDFLDSKKGRQAIYFLNEYLILNAEIRRRRLQGLRINYENVAKEQVPNKWLKLLVKSLRRRKEVPKNWKGLKVIARRLFAVEIVSQTLMSIEDLGAFCLAFGELLEETPSRIIRYENPDIANFYRTDWTPQYISDLFLFDDPHIVTSKQPLIEKINAIQSHNAEALAFSFRKITEYRIHFGRLYNKNKHGNPILYRFGLESVSPNLNVEDIVDTIFVLDSAQHPFDDVAACVVGRKTIEKSALIMTRVSDVLVTLIHRYLDYIKLQGNYPPVFVFGENPLTREEWTKYKQEIEGLLPTPLPLLSKVTMPNLSAADLFQWLESQDWDSKWFRQKDWEYAEGSKTMKSY